MARTELLFNPRIISGGGSVITKKAYYSSGAAGEDWKAGDWLTQRADGTVTPSTDNTGLGSGGTNIRYVAIADHDSSEAGESIDVAVQEIVQNTIFEGQLCASSSGATIPTQAMVGDRYDVIRSSGILGVDVDDTTNPCVEILDYEANWAWFDPKSKQSYGLVRFKVLPAFLEVAPA